MLKDSEDPKKNDKSFLVKESTDGAIHNKQCAARKIT